jgi:lipopolysaccharide export system protein LptC
LADYMDNDTGPLPLPPLAARSPDSDAVRRLPWSARLRHGAVRYLPVLLMAAIALATGWLVKNTPVVEPEIAANAPTAEPDYEMRGFSVQHYTAAGPAQGVIEGDLVRHYPLTDQLVIDGVRVRWTDPGGRAIRASAARAIAEGDGSLVRLEGGARVVRDPAPGESSPFEFTSEALVFDTRSGQVRSDRPVRLREGSSVFDALTLFYDHPKRQTELSGRVQGSISPADFTRAEP